MIIKLRTLTFIYTNHIATIWEPVLKEYQRYDQDSLGDFHIF